MVANIASIMADIGDRSAPAADGAARRAGPSRICIGISSSPPFPGSRTPARRSQHGPAMGPAAEISEPVPPILPRPRVRGRPWVPEASRTRRGGVMIMAQGSRGGSRPVGALRTVSMVFALAAIWNLENPMEPCWKEKDDTE